MKVNEIAGVGNHYSALFWEYDPRIARRWNIDPVPKDAESPYLCFNGNPIANSDKNGDDGKTAAIIFAATQEAAAAAAVTWVGAPVAVGIEVVGGLWATYELLKDVPVQIPQVPAPAQQQQPAVKKVESKDVEAQTATPTQSQEKSPTANRVKLRKETVDKIKENQPRNEEGEPIDPNDKKPLGKDKTDIGHKPGQEWRTRKAEHEAKGSTRKDVLEEENNPNLYHMERRSNNRSHKYEAPKRIYSE